VKPEVLVGRTSAAQCLVAIGSQVHLIAVRRERLHELPSRLGVVLNDENAASDFLPSSRGLSDRRNANLVFHRRGHCQS